MKTLALTSGTALLWAVLGVGHPTEAGWRRPQPANAPATARAAANPYEADAEAVRAGQKLYERHCVECHGGDARGTRWAPALVTASVRVASPGALFWFLTNGNRRAGMPSWSRLPDARRWQIVTFLKAANAAPTPRRP